VEIAEDYISVLQATRSSVYSMLWINRKQF